MYLEEIRKDKLVVLASSYCPVTLEDCGTPMRASSRKLIRKEESEVS